MGNGLSPCVSMSAAAKSCDRQAAVMGQADRGATGHQRQQRQRRGQRQCLHATDVTTELLSADHVVCPAYSFAGLLVPIAWPGERLLSGQTYFVVPRRSYFVVCPARSFVGLLVPIAWPGERLLPGQTCFVVPRRLLSNPPGGNSSGKAATLGSLLAAPGAGRRGQLACHVQCPFEYVKGGDDGSTVLIRVLLQFIEKPTELCSTLEQKQHYEQLVGAKGCPWSPRLETISERSKRRIILSPSGLLLSLQ
ncbi:hypothetical protein VPH35_019122 [Triticum aestivum]